MFINWVPYNHWFSDMYVVVFYNSSICNSINILLIYAFCQWSPLPPPPPSKIYACIHVLWLYISHSTGILSFFNEAFQSLKFFQHFNNFHTSLNTPYEYPYRTVSVYNNILVNKRRATTVHFSKTVHFQLFLQHFSTSNFRQSQFICFAVYVFYPDCFYNRQDCYR